MYGCESWIIRKAEHQRINAFELWCWRRLLRVPWPATRSNQSMIKEISPEYSLEGLMLKMKLKLHYFGHLMWRTDLYEKILMLGKIEGREKGDSRGWDGWLASLTLWTWVWKTPGVGDGQEVHGVAKSDRTEQLNWTEQTASAFRWVYLSFFPLPLASLLFSPILRPLLTTILPFCISFSWHGLDHCILYNVMNLHP